MKNEPSLPDKPDDSSFHSEYRKDKRRQGYFYIVFGILFSVWTVFDVIFAFFEEMWYFNIFFGLMGIGFVLYGIIELRAFPKKQ